jgi:hypothetical protein
MPLLNINISSAGSQAAVMVGGLTYFTLTQTGNVSANIASTGTTGVAYVSAAGMRYLAGDAAGATTFAIVNEFGQTVLKPAIQVGSKKTALVASVALGAVAGLTTTAVVYGAKKTYAVVEQYRNPQTFENVDYVENDYDDFQVIELESDHSDLKPYTITYAK